MIPEPTDAGLHRRLLIVKINHLAERIDPYIPQPISDTAAVLYRIPDVNLNRSHAQHIAAIVNGADIPDAAQPAGYQLSQALAELDTMLPPAPAPFVAPVAPAVVITLPPAAHTSFRRGRMASILAAVTKRFRSEPTFSPKARRATAAIMASATSGRPV